MHLQVSTRMTAHYFATHAQDSVTIFLIHKYGSQISGQLLKAHRFCLSAPPLILSRMFIGMQQQNHHITTQETQILFQHGSHLSRVWTCMPLP
jgi:hypothetical protein